MVKGGIEGFFMISILSSKVLSPPVVNTLPTAISIVVD